MTLRSFLTAAFAIFVFSPAFAGPSDQHSAQALNHSGRASEHGSAAVASAAATVVAIPIIAFGSVVTISGVALEEAGTGALVLGTDLARAGSGDHAPATAVQPNGAPTLD